MIKYFKMRGFTDRLYLINFILVNIVVLASFILTAVSGSLNIMDLSPINTMIGCAYGELALHTGLIVWKAKAENLNKHGNNDQITM